MTRAPHAGPGVMAEVASVVDTHLHVASPDTTTYPRHHHPLPTTTWWEDAGVDHGSLAGYLTDAGVASGLLVQAVGIYGYDNRYLLDAVSAHPERFRAVVAVDVASAECLEAIARAGGQPEVVGVRLFAIGAAGSWVGTPRAVQALQACGEAGVVAVLTALGAHLDALGPALAACPDVTVAVDHCAFPTVDAGGIVADDPVWSLVAATNVSLKITSHLFASGGPGADPALVVDQLAQSFGAHRLLWGSDHPQSALGSYPAHLRLACQATSRLQPDERADVLGASAARMFHLGRRVAAD